MSTTSRVFLLFVCACAAANAAEFKAASRKQKALEYFQAAAAYDLSAQLTKVSDSLSAISGLTGLSKNCTSALMSTVGSLRAKERWAIAMIDAAGKFPTPGMLVGSMQSLGSYWECVSIQQPLNNTASVAVKAISGQYCVVSLSPINITSPEDTLLNLKLGLCTPDACNASEVLQLSAMAIKYVEIKEKIVQTLLQNFQLTDVTCQINDMPLSPLAISGICVIAVLLFLVFIGSTYDILFAYTHGHIVGGVSKFFGYMAEGAVQLVSAKPKQEEDRAFLVPDGDGLTNSENYEDNARGSEYSNAIKREFLSRPDSRTESTEAADASTAVNFDASTSSASDDRTSKQKKDESAAKKTLFGKLLTAFSIRVNGTAIFNTKESSEQLGCLHGLRVMSMIWIITGHVYGISMAYSADIILALQHYIKSWSFEVMLNATFSVDTFFVISGLLTTYVTLKYISKVGSPWSFKWHLFYIHRYLRLTPVMAIMIYLYVAVFPYISSGPLWPQKPDQGCVDYWWTNLLYINNFYNASAPVCFGHTWYLANDMQFFIVSPLVIIPLYLAPAIGIGLIAGFVALSVVSTATISAVNDFSANLVFQGENAGQTDSLGPITSGNDIYDKPYCRIGSYAIGMLVGYILFRTNRKLKLNPWTVVFGWCVSTTFAILVLFVLYDSISNLEPLTTAASAAYLSLSRIAWSISIGWIILACATGYGGWVNKFLSWKAFAPLSRLTYCAYLVHFQMLIMYFAFIEYPSDMREFPMFFYSSGYIVLAYIGALCFSIAVEAPFLGLEKLLFGR